MLTTYDRIIRERRKLTQLQEKKLAHKLERADAPGVSDEHVVKGVIVVQVVRHSTNREDVK